MAPTPRAPLTTGEQISTVLALVTLLSDPDPVALNEHTAELVLDILDRPSSEVAALVVGFGAIAVHFVNEFANATGRTGASVLQEFGALSSALALHELD